MGRYYLNKKEEADRLIKISVFALKKMGFLAGGLKSGTLRWTHTSGFEKSVGVDVFTRCIDDHIRIEYTQTGADGNEKDFKYRIPLVTTSCNFGGLRYWLICPVYKNNRVCGKRVGVLYKSGDYFACRHCNELTYKSRNENRRNSFYPAFFIIEAHQKIDDLEDTMKRKFYAGKPTRKFKKLLKISDRAYSFSESASKLLTDGKI